MDYRELLDHEFQRRRTLNQSYSLRAFARDLGLRPSHLTEVLGRKKGISGEKAADICHRMKWPATDAVQFVNLVNREHSRNPLTRKNAVRALKTIKAGTAFQEMSLTDFRQVSNWVAQTILEIVGVAGADVESKSLSLRLGVSESDVKSALEALLSVGYLVKTSRGYKTSEKHQATPKVQSSQVIRDFHQGILKQAAQKLESVDPSAREFASLLFSIDPSRMDEAKKWLAEFRREFTTTLESKAKGSRVHCLSMQLFPLEQELEINNAETKR